jgi:hypothetical protein
LIPVGIQKVVITDSTETADLADRSNSIHASSLIGTGLGMDDLGKQELPEVVSFESVAHCATHPS